MLDYDYEDLLKNPNYKNQYVDEFNRYVSRIQQKIDCLHQNQNKLTQKKQKIEYQLEEHFNRIADKILESKKKIKYELNKDFKNFEENFGLIAADADGVKLGIANEIKKFAQIIDGANSAEKLNATQENGDEFLEEDALMINDSVNMYDDLNTSQQPNQDSIAQVKSVFENINELMNRDKKIDEIIDDENRTIVDLDTFEFVKCMPDLDCLCFGHVEKKPVFYMSPSIHFDTLNHTKFHLINKNLNEMFTFKKQTNCSITLSCPNISFIDKDYFHQQIEGEIFDSKNQKVISEIREKTDKEKRFIRIYFTPQTEGVYKLVVKYNQIHIDQSPFSFIVNTSDTSNSLNKSPQISSHQIQVIKPEPTEPMITNVLKPVNDQTVTPMKTRSLTAGRGRMLKNRMENKIAGDTASPFSPFQSQKRKSPSLQSFDLNNNYIENNDDSSMRELSSKLKKVVVDETGNTIHKYTPQSHQSISNIMSLDVIVNNSKNGHVNDSVCETIEGQVSLISRHLKKYSKSTDGLIKLLDESIPNIKAKFVCKYQNLSFPIGVRVCKTRKWVIVCDSSNNAVKIFDENKCQLLHTINGTKTRELDQPFTFIRPSAVLINYENNSEIFIKDDKEILVFDISDGCKLVRKFGFQILKRPYGLAFNKKGDLVLVDADMRNPLIYTFNKTTGEVINKKPYQPVLSRYSNTSELKSRFSGDNQMPLGSVLDPFEKSKVRFLCSCNDYLYASDLGRSIVFKTDLDGQTELAFGHHGRSKGQMNEPSGIHVDYDGQAILLGDSKNNRIQVYDGQGFYKCDLDFDEKIGRPSDIHLDSEGYLYISNFMQHDVKKFKLITS